MAREQLYLGDRKWSIFKNFFFRWSFGLEKTQNVIFLKFVIGSSGGVKIIFWLFQGFSGEILTCLALKSFSVALKMTKLTKWIFCDQMKKALSWGLEKNFLGQNRSEFNH